MTRRNVKRFRGGLVFEAHRLLYHSTLGLRAIKKRKKYDQAAGGVDKEAGRSLDRLAPVRPLLNFILFNLKRFQFKIV